jgi:hypothetical protein
MKLKLEQLQDVVKDTMNDKKLLKDLQQEARRTMGPSIVTDVSLVTLARSMNDRLNVMRLTGQTVPTFKATLMSKLSQHRIAEVRAVAARTLPSNMVGKLRSDKEPTVRYAVASRSTMNEVRAMIEKYPDDDQLTCILEDVERATDVATFDEPMGDLSRGYELDLSEEWYRNKAANILDDYAKHRMLDYNWEERAVQAFCNHSRATSLVEIDSKKLYDAVQDLIKERDDETLAQKNLFDVRISDGVKQKGSRLNEDVPGNNSEIYDATVPIHFPLSNSETRHYGVTFEQIPGNSTEGGDDVYTLHGRHDDLMAFMTDYLAMTDSEAESSIDGRPTSADDVEIDDIGDQMESRDPVYGLLEGAWSNNDFESTFKVRYGRKTIDGVKVRIPYDARLPKNEIRAVDENVLDRFVTQWNRSRSMNESFASGGRLNVSWSEGDEGRIEFKVKVR